MSPGARRAVGALYAIVALGLGLTLVFALYAYSVRTSPFISSLERQSSAYPCIGERLFPKRPHERPALQIARKYLLGGESRSPSPRWHLEFAAATYAIEAAFRPREVNRMYAALPISRYRNFDDVALTLAGRRFCSLDELDREAVREFSRTGRHKALRAHRSAGGAA